MGCYGTNEAPRDELRRLEALLCGVCTALEKLDLYETVMETVDWEEVHSNGDWDGPDYVRESGYFPRVDRDFMEDWWAHHKAKDAERRVEEALERQEAERKKAVKECVVKKESGHHDWKQIKDTDKVVCSSCPAVK